MLSPLVLTTYPHKHVYAQSIANDLTDDLQVVEDALKRERLEDKRTKKREIELKFYGRQMENRPKL